MTVKELKKALVKFDDDMDVVVDTEHAESGHSLKSISSLEVIDTTKRTIHCRDMMDGEHYETEKLVQRYNPTDKEKSAGKRVYIW